MYNNEKFSASSDFLSFISTIPSSRSQKCCAGVGRWLALFQLQELVQEQKIFSAAEALMTKFSAKTSLLSLAVLVALSGCGKSKELNTPAAPNAPAAPAAPSESAPPVPTPDLNKSLPDVNNNPDNELLPDDGKQTPPTNGGETKDKDKSTGSNASETRDPGDIDFSTITAAKTGGTSKDMYYTGAGADGLMEEFKSYGLKVSQEQQSLNKKLAQALVSARLVGTSSSDMQLDMVIDETINGSGGLKTYRLKATADGDILKLTKASATGDLDFEGGFVKCLDANGDCNNSYAKIKMSGAYVRIIFRKSHTDRHFLTQKNITNNRSFDVLKSYILNSSGDMDTNQKIESLEVASFEVTNGRAAMGAMLTTQDQQMIGLNIPLMVSGKNSEVNAAVTLSTDLSKSYPLASGASYSQKLASGISEARLVNNSGTGQLKIKLTLGTGSEKGSIWIITSPVKKELLSLEDVRQFESKLKSF